LEQLQHHVLDLPHVRKKERKKERLERKEQKEQKERTELNK